MLFALISQQSFAQCTGCTSTINTANATANIGTGQTVCITYAGTYTGTINFTGGGTLCISPATTVSSGITMNYSGSVVNVYGKVTGSVTMGNSGSAINVYSGGTFSPSSATFSAGAFNSAGTVVLTGTVGISNNMTAFNSSGSFTAATLSNNGAPMNFSGPTNIGSFTNNNGAANTTFTGTTTFGTLLVSSGPFSATGPVTVTGSFTNYATANISGSISVGGAFYNTGTINETGSGCNALAISGSATNFGTINGNGNGLVVTPAMTGTNSNGAYTYPTSQASTLVTALSGTTISGSFASTTAAITGYIVLRYVGTTAPSDNPVQATTYSLGSTIGTSTVVAIIPSGSTGTRSFTDNITTAICGKNAYYRIFAYNSYSTCPPLYNLTSPLTGSRALTSNYATITASGPTTFCSGGSVTLTATAGTSYLWNATAGGATSQSITATTSGTYTVTVTTSGCTGTATQTVTVNSAGTLTPTLLVSGQGGWYNGTTATPCQGGSVEFGTNPASGTWTLSGPNGFYSYQRDTTLTNLQPSNSGTYTATYYNTNGCNGSVNYTVTVNPNPTMTLTVTPQCTGKSDTLKATGGGTYKWNDNSTNATLITTATTAYTVTVTTTATGCTSSMSITPTYKALPSPTIAVTAACAGSSSTLTASGGTSYLWSTGAATTSITSTTATAYTVTATNAGGCTASVSATAVINTAGTMTPYVGVNGQAVTNSSTAAVCQGGSVQFSTQPGTGTWTLSGPNSFFSYKRDTTLTNLQSVNAGTYTATYTNASNGCSASTGYTVTVNPNPTMTLTVSPQCVGKSDTLKATGGGTYKWSDNSTNSTLITTGTTAYTVTVTTTATGCTSSMSLTPTYKALPTPAITVTPACTGGSSTLTAAGGTSYLWSTGVAGASITSTTATTYTVTATNAGGCSASASATAVINSAGTMTPYLMIGGGSWYNGSTATLCQGGSVEFGTQAAAGTWTLTGPNGFYSYQRDTTLNNLLPVNSGNYVATFYHPNGCTAVQNYTLTINANPTAAIAFTPQCAGGTDTLVATGGGTYAWSTGAATSSITTTTAATYTVTVTTAATGCSAVVSRAATFKANPVTSVAVTGACAGGSSTLTASGGTTYLWSTGAATASITSATVATYTVTATTSGCSTSASGTAVIYTPATTITSNTPVCIGNTATMSVTPSGGTSYSYSWSGPSSFTSSSQSPSVSNMTSAQAGNYIVTVTDNHSCTITRTAAIAIDNNCPDSTTVGINGGNSSDAPCTQVLRFDHYDDALAAAGQTHKWILKNGNILTMTVTRTAGAFTSVAAPTWSGAAFGQSGYYGLTGKTVLYTVNAGYSKIAFTNIQLKDSNGVTIPNFTLIGIDAESTDGAERDTLYSNGTSWYDYDTITPPGIGSVPSEVGIGTSTLVWAGTGPVNARARLVSTNNPTNFSFSTVAGGLQGFAMAVSNPILAPNALTICSKSSFNATPTNLPAGTTYIWSAPVISPAGSISGAIAQTTGVTTVGQVLTNNTTSPATATYYITPSNSCSSLGYTVVVTVRGGFSAAVTPSAPQCAGYPATIAATPTVAGTYSYNWSGPAGFTGTTQSITIASAALTNAGTYTLTLTNSLSCTATASGVVSVVNCVSVSGNVFDDANGDGTRTGTDSLTSLGQIMYGILSDTTGTVVATSAVAANGGFSFNPILPNTSGLKVSVNTAAPLIGTPTPANAWPSRWAGTLGQYGVNNLAGIGVYNNASEIIPVRTGTVNVTGILIGYDQLPNTSSLLYVIPRPAANSARKLIRASGLGLLGGTDAEDGVIGVGKKFVINDIAALNGNSLYYDANGDGILQSYEKIAGYTVITAFDSARLYVKYTGIASYSATFKYSTTDAAGKSDPTPSTYTIMWNTALPVKLVSFTAENYGTAQAQLKWATASEINNDHFEVERSGDGNTWTKIAEVKGAGTTNEMINYSLIDAAPLAGDNYYRLRQVDYDGKYEYSDMQVVTIDGSGTTTTTIMNVYPNPTTGSTLHISLSGSAQVVSHIQLTSAVGQVMIDRDIADEAAFLLTDIDLPAGVYLLTATTSGHEQHSSRIVISR